MCHIGQQYGVRVNTFVGWWLSLGIHVHFWPPREAHLDLHLLCFLIIIGRHYSGPRKGKKS